MSALILDAGAFIAIERDDRVVYEKIQNALRAGQPVRTNPNVVAQLWRNGAGRHGWRRHFAWSR